MGAINFENLKENAVLNEDIMLDKSFLLIPAGCPVPDFFLSALKEFSLDNVPMYSAPTVLNATPSSPDPAQAKKAPKTKTMGLPVSGQTQDIVEKVINIQNESFINEETRKKFDILLSVKEDAKRMELVKKVYDDFENFIIRFFTRYATHKELDFKLITENVKELIVYIMENEKYVLRLTHSVEERNKKFLVIHSMRTTCLSIIIGLQIKMPTSKLIELGITSILHEIGMLSISPQLYTSSKKLTIGEQKQIFQHPLNSYQIIKGAKFPLSIQLGVLEHHERENKTGYPRHLEGNQISLYGKIIAIACSYEAITAPRDFKDEKTAYEGLLELLQNKDGAYDRTFVEALLVRVSLYPIGSYVYLSNGKIAQVIEANPSDIKNPRVHVLGETDEEGKPKVSYTNNVDIKIVRVMNKSEASGIIQALENK